MWHCSQISCPELQWGRVTPARDGLSSSAATPLSYMTLSVPSEVRLAVFLLVCLVHPQTVTLMGLKSLS